MVSKKLIAFILALSIISAVIPVFLSSCADAALANAVRLKHEYTKDGVTGNFFDEANGRYYVYCGGYLRAAEINPKVYAVCPKEKGLAEVRLHEIPGLDPAKWLSENIEEIPIPLLFREQSEEEPTLAGFETERIHITISDEATIALSVIEKQEEIDIIVNDYLNGEAVPVPYYIDSMTYNFESSKYKGIYYILQCIIDAKGKIYLYDSWTKRCVPCSEKPAQESTD